MSNSSDSKGRFYFKNSRLDEPVVLFFKLVKFLIF